MADEGQGEEEVRSDYQRTKSASEVLAHEWTGEAIIFKFNEAQARRPFWPPIEIKPAASATGELLNTEIGRVAFISGGGGEHRARKESASQLWSAEPTKVRLTNRQVVRCVQQLTRCTPIQCIVLTPSAIFKQQDCRL